MTDLTAQRTLVKSPPELWSELSELESLARHLEGFGEIRISRLEPERTVAWEGEHASGTVEIEAAGWGTKVTLTAEVQEATATDSEAMRPEGTTPSRAPTTPQAGPRAAGAGPTAGSQQRTAEAAPARGGRRGRGLFGRWLSRRRPGPAPPLERSEARTEPIMAAAIADGALEIVEPGTREPRPVSGAPTRVERDGAARPVGPERAQAVLESTLEKLGQAHHRPFSRE